MLKQSMVVGALLMAPMAVAADNAQLEACRVKLKQAQALGVLHDLSWKHGKDPVVVAGRTYFNMPFDAKEGFAETVNCFLMAGKSGCINFEITHWQTGKAVDKWSWCRLKPI